MRQHNAYLFILLLLFAVSLNSCMKYESVEDESFDWSTVPEGDGIFIISEGNFMAANSSMSFYVPSIRRIENEVFYRSNSIPLGSVAQSVAKHNGRLYVVVNNSSALFVMNQNTLKVVGMISGLLSPRYIHFVSDTKAYITDLYASQITIFNPQTLEIIGHIDTPGHPSTEQMVQWGHYVFVSCWSHDSNILVVDSDTDTIVEEIEVGMQPRSMVIDKHDKIWTASSSWGSVEVTTPALYCIDAASRKIERRFDLQRGDYPSALSLNGTRDTLYYINRGVWRMSVEAALLPERAVIEAKSTIYYGLAVHPVSSDIYLADAIDYVQPGVIYRFGADTTPIDTMRVGIIPTAFCFK